MIGALAKKIFGTANERRLKTYQPRVKAINALEPELEPLWLLWLTLAMEVPATRYLMAVQGARRMSS